MDGNCNENICWGFDGNHPLLNDVILKTLVNFVPRSDLPNFRRTCKKWKISVGPKFRREFCIDLSGNTSNIIARKLARYIYAMPKSIDQIPFNWFKMSEIRIGVSSLESTLFKSLIPSLKRLTLTSKNSSIEIFRMVFNGLESIEILELGLGYRIINQDSVFEKQPDVPKKLLYLKEMKWLDIFEEEFPGYFYNVNFLTEFYSGMDNLQSLTCTKEIWKHLKALNANSIVNMRKFKFGKINQMDLLQMIELCEKGLRLEDFKCSSLANDVMKENLEEFLKVQRSTLKTLHIGSASSSSSNGEDIRILQLELPDRMDKLEDLSIKLSKNISYGLMDYNKFTKLKELSVLAKDGNFCFWEDVFQSNGQWINFSLRKLHFGIPIKNPKEILYELGVVFPNVVSLSFARPCKWTLQTVFDGVWPQVKELKIVSACPQIDQVLTGIRTRDILYGEKEKVFDDGYGCVCLDRGPSIRNLKKLQRLEINSKLTSKLHSLSCLPSDIAVHFALMKMPELRQIFVHRSLISPEAVINLQNQMPTWTTCKIEPIKFDFDETVDAFKFNRNNQYLMKLLCQYPHGSLREFSGFLTSLWVQGRLGLQ